MFPCHTLEAFKAWRTYLCKILSPASEVQQKERNKKQTPLGQPHLNIKASTVAKFIGNARHLLTILVHKERLSTNHHGDEESEHKITRTLLTCVDTLIKHSNNWNFASNFQRLHYFIFYSTTLPALSFPFNMWYFTLPRFTSPPPHLPPIKKHRTINMKTIIMKSKSHLYRTMKNQIF